MSDKRKSKTFAQLIDEQLDEVDPLTNETKRVLLARSLVNDAVGRGLKKGKVVRVLASASAQKEIMDRLDGKPTQQVQVEPRGEILQISRIEHVMIRPGDPILPVRHVRDDGTEITIEHDRVPTLAQPSTASPPNDARSPSSPSPQPPPNDAAPPPKAEPRFDARGRRIREDDEYVSANYQARRAWNERNGGTRKVIDPNTTTSQALWRGTQETAERELEEQRRERANDPNKDIPVLFKVGLNK
jgi:hypothetical protein